MKIQPPSFALRRLFLCASLAASALPYALSHAAPVAPVAISPVAPRPKLVVVLVVDGLPAEQVVRYREQFQGGFKRLLNQGASFANAHQAHGITFTAVGHSAILTGAYPYQHGIISNGWIDAQSGQYMYCTQDKRYQYIGAEQTEAADGTSPANLRVSTLGDELRYANDAAKVIAVSGKDRGAILLAGKTGTAYMYMGKTGNFASSTYYMQNHPQWVENFQAGKPQDRFYDASWCLSRNESAYAQDVKQASDIVASAACKNKAFEGRYVSDSGKPDKTYYEQLRTGPYLDQLTLEFARAAMVGEQLGQRGGKMPDVLAVSLSSHDYVNHEFGPESAKSHDHLLQLDRLLGEFFAFIEQRVGLDNTLVLLTADHGFPNTPEFAKERHFDAGRINSKTMMASLNQHLAEKFGVEKLLFAGSAPNFLLNQKLIAQQGLKREEVEQTAARFLLGVEGVADVFTRSQLENGNLPDNRITKLMQRAWHKQVSGDLLVVTKPYWYFGSEAKGTSHGSPYAYDTNVPLLMMGKPWIKPRSYGQYAEVVDIAPTLAFLLGLRPPAASEGRVLVEMLR